MGSTEFLFMFPIAVKNVKIQFMRTMVVANHENMAYTFTSSIPEKYTSRMYSMNISMYVRFGFAKSNPFKYEIRLSHVTVV